jgi:hypothetical protein
MYVRRAQAVVRAPTGSQFNRCNGDAWKALRVIGGGARKPFFGGVTSQKPRLAVGQTELLLRTPEVRLPHQPDWLPLQRWSLDFRSFGWRVSGGVTHRPIRAWVILG